MKQLHKESDDALTSPDTSCAALLMEVVPLVMRYIRMEMRSRRMRGLSIPQFRTLVFLDRNEGASLSEVANNISLTLPSASKIIDALVTRKLVIRTALPHDRRYSSLKLTKLGRATLMQARHGTEASLAEKIATLSPAQQTMVAETMQALGSIFMPTQGPSEDKGR
jgi:DNA-binding MarR family transcriptional regulator